MMFEDSEFTRAICILLRNFHALNKKIFLCNFDRCYKIKKVVTDFTLLFSDAESVKLKNVLKANGRECLFEDAIECLQQKSTEYEGFVFIFRLLMKNGKQSIEGLAFLGRSFICL